MNPRQKRSPSTRRDILKKNLEDSENQIEKIEAEIRAVDKTFMEPGSNNEDHEANYERYRELREELNEELNRWTVISQEVEEFLQNKPEWN
jgi:chromosome segregation ATPase